MSPYTSKLSIRARRLKTAFTPDGDLAKPIWKHAQWISFDHDWAGKRHYPRSQTRVAAVWTPSDLYLAYRCKYTTLNVFAHGNPDRDTPGLWNRDVVEVFLNPDPSSVNHYYEFEVAPNNLWIDLEINLDRKPMGNAAWNSGFVHATRIGKTVWSCEMRIPVDSMTGRGYELRTGLEWRGNFFRADGEGSDAERRLLAWSPTLSPKPNFHVPTRFGIIRFIK